MSTQFLDELEGDATSIVTPYGSAHVAKSLVDTHPELLVSMVLAARDEWMRWTP